MTSIRVLKNFISITRHGSVAAAAREVGVAAMFVHALNDRAKAFYAAAGFESSPVDPMVLILRIKDINALIGD